MFQSKHYLRYRTKQKSKAFYAWINVSIETILKQLKKHKTLKYDCKCLFCPLFKGHKGHLYLYC